jgi:hypothetical protein
MVWMLTDIGSNDFIGIIIYRDRPFAIRLLPNNRSGSSHREELSIKQLRNA